MPHLDLKRLDRKPIPAAQGSIRLFSVVQNEMLRLPYFLAYHRKLGVSHFFLIDNDSRDGTGEFLAAQPDCFVFHTSAPYAGSQCGTHWFNALLQAYGAGHWILKADADELLVYPHVERVGLPALCAFLAKQGWRGLYTPMVDMYAAGPLQEVHYQAGEDFLSACPYFDRDYSFTPRLGIPFRTFPALEPVGGPRLRLCFPEQNTSNPLRRVMLRLSHFKNRKTGSTVLAPLICKVPLVRWQENDRYLNGHFPLPLKLAPLRGALLHFKYFQDFAARVQDAVARENHYRGSAEYKRYAALLAKQPALDFTYAGSVRYAQSDDLLHHGLMKDHPAWRAAVA